MDIVKAIKENGTPKVVEAFVAGEFVATDPELQHLHTPHVPAMALAFAAAITKL